MIRAKILLTAAMALTFGLMFAPTTYADSVYSADLNASNDGLLTVDPNTGLEFLDPGATKGVSYNDTLNTSFVTNQGFRFASLDEYQQLLSDVGFTNFTGDFNTTDETAAENLLTNLLGETIPPGQDFYLNPPSGKFIAHVSDGFYAFTGSPSADGRVNVVGVDYQSAALGQAAQDQARVILHLAQPPADVPRPIVGGLLVRNIPVPEPSDLGLMALGLMLIGGAGFLRYRHGRVDRDAKSVV